MNYSLTAFKDKETGKPASSAVGPYQFLYNTHAKLLKSNFGVNSKEEFIGNKEAQENLMKYMLEDKPGRYPFMARRLQKDYKKQIDKDLNFSDLVALQHFVGHGDLRKLFARVRDEKDFNTNSIYEVSPKGKNLTIGEYLKRYRSGYNAADPTSMINPLEDPGLMAAGEDLPAGDYTAPKLFNYKVEIKDGVQSFMYDGKDVDEEEFRNLYKKNSNKSEEETEKELSNIITKAKAGKFSLIDKSEQIKLGLRKLTEEEVEQGFQWALSDGEPKIVRKAKREVSGTQNIKGNNVKTIEVLGPDGQMVTIPQGEEVTEDEIKNSAVSQGVESKTTEEIKELILDKVNATGKKISKEDLGVLVNDFEEQYKDSKNDLIDNIKQEIDSSFDSKGNKLTPSSGDFNHKIGEIIDRRAYFDLEEILREKNENLQLSRGALESDILDIKPVILYDYYTGNFLDGARNRMKNEFPNYHDKKIEQRKIDDILIMRSPRRPGIGVPSFTFNEEDILNANKEIQKQSTKSEKSKDIINFAFDILKSEKYDNIPEPWIAIMAEALANDYHANTPEFAQARDRGRIEALNNYNKDKETPLLLPQDLSNLAVQDLNNLSGQPFEVKKNIIKNKYGIDLDEDSNFSFPESFDEDYLKELEKVIRGADKESWKKYQEENGMEKNLLANSFEKTLFAQGLTLLTDRPLNPEWGVQYSNTEQFWSGVGGIALDLALPIIGRGTKFVTGRFANAKQKYLIKSRLDDLENFAKINNLSTKLTMEGNKIVFQSKRLRDYDKLLDLRYAKQLDAYNKGLNLIGGSTNLATWMAAGDAVNQLKETHSLEDLNYGQVLFKGVEGFGLGWITGRIGYKERDIKNKIVALGYNPVSTFTRKQVTTGVGIGAEAVAFTSVSALAGEGELSIKSLNDNFQFVLGLRATKIPMKLARNPYFTDRNQNLGIYSFKTTEAERMSLGLENKTDKEIYKEIEKNLFSKSEKEAVEYMDKISAQLFAKYVYAATGSQLKPTNPLDGVFFEAKIVPEKPNLVEVYNKNGVKLFEQKFNNEREAIEYIKEVERNKKESEGSVIIDNNLLDTESKAKLELELEKLGLTMSDVKKYYAIEKKTADQRIVTDSFSEKIIEIYNNQAKQEKAIVSQVQEGAKDLTIAQREVILKEKVEEAEDIQKETKEKKELGIEDVSFIERIRRELVSSEEPDAPIEVSESNTSKLKESAKTTRQKESIDDIIKSNEQLKGLPGKVFVHTNNTTYQRELEKAGDKGIAEYIGGHRDISTGNIHYNLSAMNKRTAAHETKHSIADNLRKSNPEKYKEIEAEVYKLIQTTPEYAGVLDFINTRYESGERVYKSEAERKNEALVEFMARNSRGEYKLLENNTFINSVKKYLNSAMEKIGVNYRFATNNEALAFINSLEIKAQKGEIKDVKETDVKTETTPEVTIEKRVNEQVKYHNENQGSTFDQQNKIVKEGYSVSRYPDRTKLVKGKKVTKKDISDFIEANKDILSKNPNAVIGTWYNEKDNQTYLDVSEVQKNKEKAIELAKKYNQISIFDLKTFKEIETGGTGKVLSEKQIARKNFNDKIKNIRKSYEDKISKVKQDFKADKKAVKEIKKELLDYIKGSDVLNKVIKKTVLKQAVNVDNPKKLDRFISTVEEIGQKESLSSSRAEAKEKIKGIKKKLKKGLYGNQTSFVEELINKDLLKVEDLATLNNLNSLLTDLNRQKQPLIDPKKIKESNDKIEQISSSVEAKVPKIKNESQINVDIQKLTDRIKESKLDVQSTDGAKEVISINRALEKLKKSLYNAEQSGNITQEKSEKIIKKIIKLEEKIAGKTTKFNRERFDISQEILKNSDLKKLSKYEKELIEDLKEVEFVDNIGFNDNLFVASLNISNGVPPVNVVGRLLIESNNNKHSNNLSELLINRIDKYAGKKKPESFFLFDRIPKNMAELERRLSYTPLGLISEIFRAEKDVKNAGLLDKEIIAPLTRAMTKYDRDTRQTLERWENATGARDGKFSKWIEREVSGNILALPLTKYANPIYRQKVKSDNKVGVILAQIQRNTIDNTNVLKTILEKPNLINTYKEAEIKILKEIYKELPKKTVDGKEVIDIKKAKSQLTAREKKMINEFRRLMDTELLPKQNYSNGIRGIPFEGVNQYYPLILNPKARSKVLANKEHYQSWTEEIFINSNKLASNAGKERTSTDINAIDFNVNRVVNNRVREVNTDFYFTQPSNIVRELLKDAKIKSGENYEGYFNALNNRMKDAVGLHLQYERHFLNSELLSPLLQSLYSSRLVRAGRLITEIGAETGRTFFGAAETPREILTLESFHKQATDLASANINKLGNLLNKSIDKDLKEADLQSSMQTILKLTNSQFLNRYSRHDMEFSKDITGQTKGLFNRASNWALSSVDRNTLHLAYMPAFKAEFKKITGKDFSYSEIKKPEYQKKYKKAILDAAAIGDRAAMQWKNVGVKGAGRTAILTVAGPVRSTSEFAPVLTFMGNFGYLEVSMARKAIRDIMAGESLKTKEQGARAFTAIMGAGIAYGMGITAEYLVMDYFLNKFIIMRNDENDKMGRYDSEKELRILRENFDKEWDKMFTRKGIKDQVVSNALFLAQSQYGASGRAAAAALGAVYDEWLKTKGRAAGMSKQQIQDELLENETQLRKLLEVEDGMSTAEALVKEGLYVTPTADPGELFNMLLPHINNLIIQVDNLKEDYIAFMKEKNTYDPESAKFANEKFRKELAVENMLVNMIRIYLMLRGTAIAQDVTIQKYYDIMMDRFDKAPIEFYDATQGKKIKSAFD